MIAGSTLWVVGHAIYLPAAALRAASVAGCRDQEVILSSNANEAEGYLIDLESYTAEYINRLSIFRAGILLVQTISLYIRLCDTNFEVSIY